MEHATTHPAPGTGAPSGDAAGAGAAVVAAGALGADLAVLAGAWQRLAVVSAGPVAQPERIEAIRVLEDLKDAACAAQAELAVAVVATEVAAAEETCDTAEPDRAGRDGADGAIVRGSQARLRERRVARARRSAIGQVALARRESPHCGQVFVGAAEVLVGEMPHTLAALRAGVLNEYRARILVRETACLDKEARTRVDREVCADQRALHGVGTKRLEALAKGEAYREDPGAVVKRAERDEGERCVTLRPAPGAMTYLTALVPLAQGVAMLAALRRAADTARATGDPRAKGQVMADTLVERVTGQSCADGVPVAVQLVMSDQTLLASGHDPAVMDGGHMVPAQAARELVARAMDSIPESTATPESATEIDRRRSARRVGAWVRRLYADAGGNLIGMDSRSRLFPAGLGSLLRVRDQGLCRTPWCDAPVAHLDHITPAADGGATTAANGQGLCAGCNYTKQATGWTQHVHPEADRHTVTTTTPTGHEYSSTAPRVPAPLAIVTPTVATGQPITAMSHLAAAALPEDLIDVMHERPGDSPVEVALLHAA